MGIDGTSFYNGDIDGDEADLSSDDDDDDDGDDDGCRLTLIEHWCSCCQDYH